MGYAQLGQYEACMTNKLRHSNIQLCLFDTQYDRSEVQEEQKILAFYPSETPTPEQFRVTGLLQAASTLVSTFDAVR